MPPEFSNVPYQIKPMPRWGTRPTRAVASAIVNITQLPVWVAQSLYWGVMVLGRGVVLLWGWVYAALRVMAGWVVGGAVSSVKKAVGGVVNVVAGVAERVYADVPVGGVEVEAELEVGMGGMDMRDMGDMGDMGGVGMADADDWMQVGTGDAWDVPGVGSDRVIF